MQTMNTEIMPTPGECEQPIPADLPSGPPSSKNYEVVAKITGAGNLPSQILLDVEYNRVFLCYNCKWKHHLRTNF